MQENDPNKLGETGDNQENLDKPYFLQRADRWFLRISDKVARKAADGPFLLDKFINNKVAPIFMPRDPEEAIKHRLTVGYNALEDGLKLSPQNGVNVHLYELNSDNFAQPKVVGELTILPQPSDVIRLKMQYFAKPSADFNADIGKSSPVINLGNKLLSRITGRVVQDQVAFVSIPANFETSFSIVRKFIFPSGNLNRITEEGLSVGPIRRREI